MRRDQRKRVAVVRVLVRLAQTRAAAGDHLRQRAGVRRAGARQWAHTHGVTLAFIAPGKPVLNA